MPAIEAVCRAANVSPADLKLIGVSLGPGGFTGVRIGVVTAKVLAETVGCALVGVRTAEILAAGAGAAEEGERLAVCLAAKRDTVWTEVFLRRESAWLATEQVGVLPAAELLTLTQAHRLIADEHLPQQVCKEAAERGVPVDTPKYDAQACLHLSLEKAARGEATHPIDITPIYPREPEAVSKWKESRIIDTKSGT